MISSTTRSPRALARGVFHLCIIFQFVFFAAALANAQHFEVAEASIADLQKAMTSGAVTSKALVQAYLNRIEAFDTHGPKLNSLITVNPNALKEAEALDQERAAKGPRGPLHGIPIIVKDNYDTADMPTTAGSLALLGHFPSRDGFQIRKLRDAGAVIIGKSNLHELASGITTISSAGGQTLNPYNPSRNPGGSSGGTGAAIAASLAAAGMGSDTCGSIRIPSSQNNLVGLRPTKGLSSISGIVPLSVSQDVAGPLARTVADLAVVLDVTVGEDPDDAATKLRPGQNRPRFADALKTDALRGTRIGTFEPLFGDASDDQDVIRLVRAAVDELKRQGATVVSVAMPNFNQIIGGSSVIDLEFRDDLSQYFASSGNPPVSSLQEILDKGLYHASLDGSLRRRNATKGRNSDEYGAAIAKRAAVQEAILKIFSEQMLDAIVYPTMKRKPARIGEGQAGSNCQLSPTTGFPAISIPAGFTTDGLPVGMELLARPFEDARLVGFAYAYEQGTHHRRPPVLTPPLGTRTAVEFMAYEAKITLPGGGQVAARFSFDPATNALFYNVSTVALPASELRSATVHRAKPNETGPVIFMLANRPFRELTGVERLTNSDRVRLLAGELYLQINTRIKPVEGYQLRLTPAK